MIKFENVSKSYEDKNLAIVNLNLEIDDGEFVFVVGDSGSGKSTFLRLLLREQFPTSGTITVNGQRLDKIKYRKLPAYRRNLGIVFQDFRLLADRNVYDNVALAQRVISAPFSGIRERVTAALSNVGLSAKYKSFPRNLSGGEQQRVAIARAMVNRPGILLCDEPTGNLDPKNSLEIMKLLLEENSRGTTVIVVTHDMELVEHINRRVIRLSRGVLVSDSKEASGDMAAGGTIQSDEAEMISVPVEPEVSEAFDPVEEMVFDTPNPENAENVDEYLSSGENADADSITAPEETEAVQSADPAETDKDSVIE